MALAKQILTVLNEKLPIQSISLKPTASIGIAMYHGGLAAEQLYRRASIGGIFRPSPWQKSDSIL